MPFLKFMTIYYSKKKDAFLKKYLVQELVRTAGADNAKPEVSKNHSAMRLLLDVTVKRNERGQLFVVVDSGGTTHNIFPHREDMFEEKRWLFTRTPSWAKFEPRKGAHPIESSKEEIEMGMAVVKEIALKTYELINKG